VLSVQVFASVSDFPRICTCVGVTGVLFVSTGITAHLAVTSANNEAQLVSIIKTHTVCTTVYRLCTRWQGQAISFVSAVNPL
jgi:hypothetical protein